MKTPSEVIEIVLAETLASGTEAKSGVLQYVTVVSALYHSALPDAPQALVEKMLKCFGAEIEEFPRNVVGIYAPETWGNANGWNSVDSVDNWYYRAFQINKAFFLMMMAEWFAANPEEDSWEAVAKWDMEMEEKQKLVENETEIKEMKND